MNWPETERREEKLKEEKEEESVEGKRMRGQRLGIRDWEKGRIRKRRDETVRSYNGQVFSRKRILLIL